MDLGILQRDVAHQIGVDEITICNWVETKKRRLIESDRKVNLKRPKKGAANL